MGRIRSDTRQCRLGRDLRRACHAMPCHALSHIGRRLRCDRFRSCLAGSVRHPCHAMASPPPLPIRRDCPKMTCGFAKRAQKSRKIYGNFALTVRFRQLKRDTLLKGHSA